jgi:hypothetical protein
MEWMISCLMHQTAAHREVRTHLAPVAGLSGAVRGALLARARALRVLLVVVDVQIEAGVLCGQVRVGARIAVVVVHGALHRHGRQRCRRVV